MWQYAKIGISTKKLLLIADNLKAVIPFDLQGIPVELRTGSL